MIVAAIQCSKGDKQENVQGLSTLTALCKKNKLQAYTIVRTHILKITKTKYYKNKNIHMVEIRRYKQPKNKVLKGGKAQESLSKTSSSKIFTIYVVWSFQVFGIRCFLYMSKIGN